MATNDRKKIAKRRQRRRRRRLKTSFKIFSFFAILIVAGGAFLGFRYYQSKHAPDPFGKLDDVEGPYSNTYDLTEETMPDAKYWVLEVGDGEAIYIQCGQTDILIDTGAGKKARKVIEPVQKELNGSLDYLLITSTSDRRIGGLESVCKELKPDKIITCPLGDKAVEIKKAVGNIEMEEGTDTTMSLSENAMLAIFKPEVSSKDPLDQSLMTFFRYGDTSFFAESDAGEEEEARVIEQVGSCDAAVLARGGSDKVNQHIGELTCSTYIASCKAENTPSSALINNVSGSFYATYRSGTIKFTTNGKDVESTLDNEQQLRGE